MNTRKRFSCVFAVVGTLTVFSFARADEHFDVVEASIGDVHDAMAEGRITARSLVERSLARIEAYDKAGPAINAIITINPNALARADELDAAYAQQGITGPLHGIPVIVKDNYDTGDLPTSAGSLSLLDSRPADDAWQVRKLREAGAIILAKSNMYEFAFSPYETLGSALPGHTRNPYATNRVPAGSSGGTAVAVAASFGVVGLGTDTGNSIRGPSSHNALVGLRSTIGLTSRDGIVPLYLDHDVGGPMTRTVRDTAIVLEVIAGHDPADPVTAAAVDVDHGSYLQYLDADGLDGARIGVLSQLVEREGADAEVNSRFAAALDEMRSAGASIVDDLRLVELDMMVPPVEGERLVVWCPRFRHDLEAYLSAMGDAAPYQTVEQIIESGKFHPQLADRLEYAVEQAAPDAHEECRQSLIDRERLRTAVRDLLSEHNLDALVYPSWSNPPRLIGDKNTPHGDNSQHISPHTGFPAITVPMGYARGNLPVGLQFVADAFSEPTLLKLAYAYEQATGHRRPPESTPALD